MKLLCAALLSLVVGNVSGDDRTTKEIDSIRDSYLRVAGNALDPLRDKYIASLESLSSRFTRGGDLQSAIQVGNEIMYTKLGGLWKISRNGKGHGYISIHRDLTVMSTLDKVRGVWSRTEDGITITWENKTKWKVRPLDDDDHATASDESGASIEFGKE